MLDYSEFIFEFHEYPAFNRICMDKMVNIIIQTKHKSFKNWINFNLVRFNIQIRLLNEIFIIYLHHILKNYK